VYGKTIQPQVGHTLPQRVHQVDYAGLLARRRSHDFLARNFGIDQFGQLLGVPVRKGGPFDAVRD